MDLGEVNKRIAAVRGKLDELGVESLRLFGSVARGDASATSDLDFLVEFSGAATFDRYMGVKEILEATFGVAVDLVTIRALKPQLKETVFREAVRVA